MSGPLIGLLAREIGHVSGEAVEIGWGGPIVLAARSGTGLGGGGSCEGEADNDRSEEQRSEGASSRARPEP